MVLTEVAYGARRVTRGGHDDEGQVRVLNFIPLAAEQNICKITAGQGIQIPAGGAGRQVPVRLVQPQLAAGGGYDLFHRSHMVKMAVGQ